MPDLFFMDRAAEMMYALDQVTVTGDDLIRLSDVPSEVCENMYLLYFEIL